MKVVIQALPMYSKYIMSRANNIDASISATNHPLRIQQELSSSHNIPTGPFKYIVSDWIFFSFYGLIGLVTVGFIVILFRIIFKRPVESIVKATKITVVIIIFLIFYFIAILLTGNFDQRFLLLN